MQKFVSHQAELLGINREIIIPGVLNFHFGIGVRPKGPHLGLKEPIGTTNRGLNKCFFFFFFFFF